MDKVILRDTTPNNWREDHIQNVQEQFGMVDYCTKENATIYTLETAIRLIRIVNAKSNGARNLTYDWVE